MRVTHVFSSPVADATGTLTVWAGSTTATAIATDMVRPTNWNSAHGLVQDIGGNTLGVSSVSGSNIVLAGGANITLSGVQGANVGSVTIVGGTGEVGTGTTFGGTNISGSMTLNSAGLALSLSGGAGGGGGSINVSAGTTSNNLTNFVMSNSNNVSFGLNGSTITATANARASNDGIGLNTAQTNVTWTVNSSGLSLNAAGYAGTGTTFGGTNISASITQNSNGIALSLSGLAALTSQSNQAASAANGSFAFQTISFSNLNGISFGTSAGSAITASHNALTSQSNQALSAANGSFTFQTAQFSNANGVSFVTSAGSAIAASVNTAYVGLNTAQTNVTWTVNSSGISLNAAGYAGTGTTFNGANISGSITQNSAGLNLSLSVAAPGAAAVNVSAGTTSNNVTQIVFSNSNGVTFGLDGSTVTASAAGGGGGGGTLSYWANGVLGQMASGQILGGGSQSTSFFAPVMLPAALAVDFVRLLVSYSTNSTSFATAANTSYGWVRASTHNFVWYNRNTGASSQSLASLASTAFTQRMSLTLTANANGSEYSVGATHTYFDEGLESSYTWSYASTQTRFDLATNSLTAFTGLRFFDSPFATTLGLSNYWLGFGLSTSSSATGSNVGTNLYAGFVGYLHARGFSAAVERPGLATNSTNALYIGAGSFTTAGGGTTGSLGFSNISTVISQAIPFLQFIRSA